MSLPPTPGVNSALESLASGGRESAVSAPATADARPRSRKPGLTPPARGEGNVPFIAGGWLGDQLLTLTRENLADLGVPKDQRGDLMLAVEALRQGEGPLTLPDERAPSYAPQFTRAVVAECRALGREPPRPWVDAVADAWPGPIAHEYHRLRELLADGHRPGDLSAQGPGRGFDQVPGPGPGALPSINQAVCRKPSQTGIEPRRFI